MVNKHSTEKIKLVALCEFAFHTEVLRSYILHFIPIVDNLLIFTSKAVYDQLYDVHDRTNIKWSLYYNHEQLSYFISDNHEHIANCNLVVITSLPDKVSNFKPFIFSNRVWIVIHNNNTVFGDLWSNLYFRNGLDFFKDTMKFFLSIFSSKRELYAQILNSCENIILPSEAIAFYNDSHQRQLRFKEPLIIPFAHYDGIMNNFTNQELIKIVVPGTISKNVRDYKLLFDALESLLPHIKVKVELVLLGRLKEEGILVPFEKVIKEYKDIFLFNYYTDFIDQKHFDKTLAEADFLILPLKECVSHGGRKEYFGLTTESGSINDFVRFGKPAIIPEFYPIHEGLEPLLRRYHDVESMAQCILFFAENVKSRIFAAEAIEGLEYYSSDQVSQRIITQWNRD